MCITDTDVTGEQEIANAFNDHFSTVADALDRAIPSVRGVNPLDYMGELALRSMYVSPTNGREFNNIIMSFPSKRCHGKTIPIYVYKCLSYMLSPIIADMLNDMIPILPYSIKELELYRYLNLIAVRNVATIAQYNLFRYFQRYLKLKYS